MVGLTPTLVKLISHSEVQGQARIDFEVVAYKEVILPAITVHLDGRKCTCRAGRNAEQEVRVRMSLICESAARETIRERYGAEEVRVRAQAVVGDTGEVDAGLDTVPSAEPVQLVLKLFEMIP